MAEVPGNTPAAGVQESGAHCIRCGGTDDLMDQAMMPGQTYCRWCREALSWRDAAAEATSVHARTLVRLSQDALFHRATDAEARELALIDELAALRAEGGRQ